MEPIICSGCQRRCRRIAPPEHHLPYCEGCGSILDPNEFNAPPTELVKWDRLSEGVQRTATYPLTREVAEEVAWLGRPQSIHRTGSATTMFLCGIAILCLIVAVSCFVTFLSVEMYSGRLFAGVFLGGLGFIWAVAHLVRNLLWPLDVILFPKGLLFVRGQRRAVCSWDEVAFLREYRGTLFPQYPTFRLEQLDGVRVSLPKVSLSHFSELIARIQRELVQRQLPGVRLILDRGEFVEFGPFALSKTAVRHRTKLLSWGKFAGVNIEPDGTVALFQKDSSSAWAKADVSSIPNFCVFQAVIGLCQEA